MKVLHIFNALMPSGAETMWCAASAFLEKNGIETHVLSTGTEVGPYADVMKTVGFKVYHIKHSTRRLWDLRYSIALYRLIKQEAYEVIQIHPEAWRLTNVIIARLAGVTTITTTIHSIFSQKGLHWLRRVIGFRIIRLAKGHIIAIGNSVMENERRFFYRPQLIYNWIDMGRFRRIGCRAEVRKELGILEEKKVLLLVGNCSNIKNHTFLLHVLQSLSDDFMLVHVGRECDDETGERSSAIRLGVMSRIMFLGTRTDVPRLLEAADIFVMCSLLEGMGLSCLEALAKGVPSVVSDVQGLRDIAALFPLCKKSALVESEFAHKIIEVAKWSEEEVEMRRQATMRELEANFNMERGVSKYIEIWNHK